MGAVEVWLTAGSLIAVAVFWLVPAAAGQNAVAAITAVFLACAAPASALWLVGSIMATPSIMRLGEAFRLRGLTTALWSATLAALLVGSRAFVDTTSSALPLIGGAYFTLRHIHVLVEWWLGRVQIPGLAAYARYHLFLPVMLVGPIHRMPHFERQCARRRWSPDDFYAGAERALFSLTVAVVVGGFAFVHVREAAQAAIAGLQPFLQDWALSMLDWVRLYIQFAGYTGLALGLSLMMGLRLEENFAQPWRARNLVDFWSRWHMTLSHWCRDYVYAPIAAAFRAPVLGAFAAMLVLGLWHETSVYYVLWALWQATGIVVTQAYLKSRDPLGLRRLPAAISAVAGPLATLAWLSGARPVIERALEVAA